MNKVTSPIKYSNFKTTKHYPSMFSLRNILSYMGIIHIYMCVTVFSRQRCKTIEGDGWLCLL